MTQDDSMMTVETGAELPTSSQPGSCCRWRSTLQVPFLLFAAAGLGFSGQQLWQNEGDIAALLGSSSGGSCGSSASCCSQSASCMSSATPSACCAEASMALAHSAEQDQATEAAVSALSPQNVNVQDAQETAVF